MHANVEVELEESKEKFTYIPNIGMILYDAGQAPEIKRVPLEQLVTHQSVTVSRNCS